MKIRRLRSIVVAMVILGITWSCQKQEDLNPSTEEQTYLSESNGEGLIKLGKKLENPYSVENMRKAWEKLKESHPNGRTSGEGIEITTTHRYLKFKPQNEEELAVLKGDSTLILYEYPLDYEIVKEGTYYRDPSIPIGVPTYQYVSIPISKKIPDGVEYELLANLFIPDEYKDTNVPSGRIASNELVESLVDEAFRITGNLNATSLPNGRVQAVSWRPAGRIRVWDNSISPNNWRPIEGVEVKARRWFTTHKGITNAQGFYSCDGTFTGDANYSLDWERYQFDLKEGWLNGADIDGPNKRGNWNLDLNSGKNMFHARIFMAAYHYYYKDIKGLRRPPANGTFKTQMSLRCYNEDNSEKNGSHAPGRRFLGLGSAIHIYNPNRAMIEIYGTTIHELAHASHWNMTSSDYNNASDKVAESWARGVQWELTRMVWDNYFGGPTIRPNYTQVVVDMIDPNYSSSANNRNNGLWNDNVTGYSIRQIEDALNGQRTWNGWRDNIRNRYANPTENNLAALFAHWN